MTKDIEGKVLKRLKAGKSITHFQCINWWKSYKLAVYISRLRRKNFRVETEKVTSNGVSYARYSLK